MIQRTASFKASDGSVHETLVQAQGREIYLILVEDGKIDEANASRAVGILLARSEQVVDVLTTKENSLVKARKANGGTKKRGKRHEAAQSYIPGTEPKEEKAA